MVLAAAIGRARRAQPGRAVADHSLAFDAEGWKRFAEGVEMATVRCRERGSRHELHVAAAKPAAAPAECRDEEDQAGRDQAIHKIVTHDPRTQAQQGQ